MTCALKSRRPAFTRRSVPAAARAESRSPQTTFFRPKSAASMSARMEPTAPTPTMKIRIIRPFSAETGRRTALSHTPPRGHPRRVDAERLAYYVPFFAHSHPSAKPQKNVCTDKETGDVGTCIE